MSADSAPQETQSVRLHPSDFERADGPAAPRVPGLTPYPREIGPYRILETLGEGGMGIVYLAEQTKPIHRRVALKIIKLGMDTRQVIARFETEREALALMNHPNVAKVFDAGATETGRPYFVMEYVQGIPITEYCDKHRLNTEERLRLFVDVCNAIQHAHQKGIIHRDIKPSNVLVSVDIANPPLSPLGKGGGSSAPLLDKGGLGGITVKVIDFGVAKATQHRLSEHTLYTEQGQLIGTPGYMSPEQAEMTALDIDTRTDVYSLGVLLYELLVGAMPFDTETLLQRGFAEIQRVIREVEPPKPSTKLSMLGSEPGTAVTGSSDARSSIDDIAHRRHTEPKTLIRQIRGDLDWIVMRAMEKDRTRRYDTANGLALEIRRYLSNEPVLAGPPGAGYRFKKFVRRKKGPVAAVATVLIILIGGVIVSTSMYLRAAANEAKAKTETTKAVAVTKFLQEMLASINPDKAMGNDVTVRKVLDAAALNIGKELADQPEVEGIIRYTIAETYDGLGLYSEAIPHLERNLELWRILKGEDARGTIEYTLSLAGACFEAGRDDDAIRLFRQVLEHARRLFNDFDEDSIIARAAGGLGNTLRSLDRLDEAEPLLREALELIRQRNLPDDLLTAGALHNLAILLIAQERPSQAEPFLVSAADIQRRILGPQNQGDVRILRGLGELYAIQGRVTLAEQMFRESADMGRGSLGIQHPETLDAVEALALFVRNEGHRLEAEQLYREALTAGRKTWRNDHPRVLRTLEALAWTLGMEGKNEEAESLQRECLATRQRLYTGDHEDVAEAMNNLAVILGDRGEYEEAWQLHNQALEMRRRIFGGEHLMVAESLFNQARLAKRQGDLELAERLLWDALAMHRRCLGNDDPQVLHELVELALVLKDRGKIEDAETLLNEAVALAHARWGEEHQETTRAMANLSHFLVQTEQASKAEPILQECLEVRRRTLGADHWLVMNTMSVLGESLAAQARFNEAESLLLDGYQGLVDNPNVPANYRADRIGEALQRIVRLYDAWSAAEPGKGYAEKATEWREKLDEVNAETPE
jgi:serine/threonine protein kinase/tetratricopeptide (TPR) repeat protein